ncbi:MAG: sugar transferase [Deltaproteobacteria bacterium]|nr:sugar transferase [Deltaproteobacteria bacterium]
MKRKFDLFFSSLGLILLAPFFLSLIIVIRRDGGPAFFRQRRVGLRGRIFSIYKFRTMIVDADRKGGQITVEYDPRITKIGRMLRKTKLDELPQLLNVWSGDMSLVGPRPEVPFYVGKWSEADRAKILSIKPGITDYATLFYNDEQGILAEAYDPEKAYIKHIMPHKLQLYKQYVHDQSFWLDFRIIVATLCKMVGFNKEFLLPGIKVVQ